MLTTLRLLEARVEATGQGQQAVTCTVEAADGAYAGKRLVVTLPLSSVAHGWDHFASELQRRCGPTYTIAEPWPGTPLTSRPPAGLVLGRLLFSGEVQWTSLL